MQNILIEVNLSHIRQNAAWFLSGTNAKLCAVVKANAYGHGALQIAEALRPTLLPMRFPSWTKALPFASAELKGTFSS